jgi:hypothetical protein
MGEGAFAHHINLAPLLTSEKGGCGHGGGIKAILRNIYACCLEAILQVFRGLARIISNKEQGCFLFYQSMDEGIGSWNKLIIMENYPIDITDDTSFIVQMVLLGPIPHLALVVSGWGCFCNMSAGLLRFNGQSEL